jgi:hypothetical protein
LEEGFIKPLDTDFCSDTAKKTKVGKNDFSDSIVNHPAKQNRVCNENMLLSEPG